MTPPGPGSRANPGRVAAARALIAVDEGAHAEDVLAARLPDGPDGRLAWHLTLGTLRHRAQVDAALRPFLKQPLATLDPPVRAVLRMGAFEKLFSRAPDHAVVAQGVEVARKVGAGRASGLVNAVLRRVRPADRLSRAEALDHPAWLVARWDQRYGPEVTTAWCERNRTVAPICLVTRDEPALDALIDGAAEPATLGGQVLVGTRVVQAQADLPGIEEGVAWVQDPASVRVSDLLGDAVLAAGGSRVLDTCASPGGKSARLHARGLRVTATDLEGRLLKLGAGMERLRADVDVRAWDWSAGPIELPAFDGVLVDAPCSGLGTVRRHPEIRWRRHPTDLPAMAGLQRTILGNAASCVAPGGHLVYAVCSPEPEEGQEVVDAFLAQHPAFTVRQAFSSAPPVGEEDAHQAWLLQREP